jgi:ABC-type bacteriocin/lantibiotic exporter with double-glycine peptidase domain
MHMPFGLRQQSAILKTLALYVLRRKPYIVFAILIGIFSSALEVAAMASLIPLSLLASGATFSATSKWLLFPHALGLQPDVRFFAIAFLVLIAARTLLGSANMAQTFRIYRTLIAHFSSRAMDAFIWHLSFDNIQKQEIGHFIALTGDEANRAAQIIMYLMRIVPTASLLVFYIITLIFQSWTFGMLLVCFFGLTALCLQQAFRISMRLGKIQQEQARQASTHLLESLNGLRTVRGFNGEAYVASRYERMMNDYVGTCLKIDYINLASRAIPALVLMLAVLAIAQHIDLVWFRQNLSFIFIGVMMTLRVLPLAGQLLEAGLRLITDLRAAENIGTVLDAVVSGQQQRLEDAPRSPPSNTIRTIEFRDVTFRYAENTAFVLHHFNQVFQTGKSYAIVGPSGVGKSSMIDLMLKFYAPQSGEIRINDLAVSCISSAWIRERVALAEQATRLFYDTVLSNVIFGRKADREIGARAIRAAGLEDFIASLPKGLETVLQYQGSNFSGGQRQRIGLARALLLPADVLVIDEGTSALDAASKSLVVQSILSAYRDKIVIFVTHDHTVIESVDEVVTLSAARPLETKEEA